MPVSTSCEHWELNFFIFVENRYLSMKFSIIMSRLHYLFMCLLAIFILPKFSLGCSVSVFVGIYCLLNKLALYSVCSKFFFFLNCHMPFGIVHTNIHIGFSEETKTHFIKLYLMLTPAMRQGDRVCVCKMENENRSELYKFFYKPAFTLPMVLTYACQS